MLPKFHPMKFRVSFLHRQFWQRLRMSTETGEKCVNWVVTGLPTVPGYHVQVHKIRSRNRFCNHIEMI